MKLLTIMTSLIFLGNVYASSCEQEVLLQCNEGLIDGCQLGTTSEHKCVIENPMVIVGPAAKSLYLANISSADIQCQKDATSSCAMCFDYIVTYSCTLNAKVTLANDVVNKNGRMFCEEQFTCPADTTVVVKGLSPETGHILCECKSFFW